MTATQRKQREQAAGVLIAQADAYEHSAKTEHASDPAKQLRLRGRALQSRGSAWVLQAEVMEAAS